MSGVPIWPPRSVRAITWLPIEPIGKFSAGAALASLPMSILAGFSLGAAVSILLVEERSVLLAAGSALFALAGGLLLQALHHSISADAHMPDPETRLAWFPEAKRSVDALDEMRRRQREDLFRHILYRDRATNSYFAGLAAVTAGVSVVLLAPIDGWGNGWSNDAHDFAVEAVLSLASVAVLSLGLRVLSFSPAIASRLPAFSRNDSDLAAKRERVALEKGHARSIFGRLALNEVLSVDPPERVGGSTDGPERREITRHANRGDVEWFGGDDWWVSCSRLVRDTVQWAYFSTAPTPYCVNVGGEVRSVLAEESATREGVVFRIRVDGAPDFDWSRLAAATW